MYGQFRGWRAHLELGTNLLVDFFGQDKEWCDELVSQLHASGAMVVTVGVSCGEEELERRERERAGAYNRPLSV